MHYKEVQGSEVQGSEVDELVKSLTTHETVIPAKAGIQYFQAVATFYGAIKFNELVKNCHSGENRSPELS